MDPDGFAWSHCWQLSQNIDPGLWTFIQFFLTIPSCCQQEKACEIATHNSPWTYYQEPNKNKTLIIRETFLVMCSPFAAPNDKYFWGKSIKELWKKNLGLSCYFLKITKYYFLASKQFSSHFNGRNIVGVQGRTNLYTHISKQAINYF